MAHETSPLEQHHRDARSSALAGRQDNYAYLLSRGPRLPLPHDIFSVYDVSSEYEFIDKPGAMQ